MNILIIVTYFPPDSTIGAVRPYMFARHLAEAGEQVTVLRAGCFEMPPFDEYEEAADFEVISALGRNCDAEKFRRGEYQGFKENSTGRFRSLPRLVRLPVKAVRDAAVIISGKPPKCVRRVGSFLKCKKRSIDRLCEQGRHFDVVFSTCGDLENIYAGKYAAERFGAEWIMDFRDSMITAGKMYNDFWWNKFAWEATECALENADLVTAASCALSDELREMCPGAEVRTLYNGFDDREAVPDTETDPGCFSMCYTGRLYDDQLPALKELAACLAGLIRQGKVKKSRIRFKYAGSSYEEFFKAFKAAGIPDVLENHGYLSKSDTLLLQTESDLFTVLSWNANRVRGKGILTGKFYEGIRALKPILTLVSGTLPDSELMQLQEQYNYGFCFEQARAKEAMPALEEYIERLYREKMTTGRLSCKPSQELYDAFSYTTLSKKLRGLMYELTDKEIGKK